MKKEKVIIINIKQNDVKISEDNGLKMKKQIDELFVNSEITPILLFSNDNVEIDVIKLF